MRQRDHDEEEIASASPRSYTMLIIGILLGLLVGMPFFEAQFMGGTEQRFRGMRMTPTRMELRTQRSRDGIHTTSEQFHPGRGCITKEKETILLSQPPTLTPVTGNTQPTEILKTTEEQKPTSPPITTTWTEPGTDLLDFNDLLMNYEYPSSMLEYPVTTVTAFFIPSGKAKHSMDEYRAWLSNLVTTNSQPMVIATSKDFFPFIASLRYKTCLEHWGVPEPQWDGNKGNGYNAELPTACYKTYWILEFNDPFEVPTIKPHFEELQTLQQKDPEKGYVTHTPFLYAVWAAKAWFLNHTATLNPFHSNYFNYIDAGYCREEMCRYPTLVDYKRVIDAFEGFDDEHTMHITDKGERPPEFARTSQKFPFTPTGGNQMQQLCRFVHATESNVPGGVISDKSAFFPHDDWPTTPAKVHCEFPRATHPHPSVTPVRSRRHKMLFEQVGDVNFELRHEFRCPRPVRTILEPKDTDPRRTNSIYLAGGFIMGSGPAVRWYSNLYNSTLMEYTRNGWYWGSDQAVSNYLASIYPNSFLMVDSSPHLGGTCINPWFFFPEYFQPPWNRRCAKEQYFPEKLHPMVDNCEVFYPNEDMHFDNLQPGRR